VPGPTEDPYTAAYRAFVARLMADPYLGTQITTWNTLDGEEADDPPTPDNAPWVRIRPAGGARSERVASAGLGPCEGAEYLPVDVSIAVNGHSPFDLFPLSFALHDAIWPQDLTRRAQLDEAMRAVGVWDVTKDAPAWPEPAVDGMTAATMRVTLLLELSQ
jgi:hypothetical protein